ncbi:striated muscle preferentially expressed protein kinase isoform X4 [Esox lucius]|uniref:striated muscle preferentially expressed protein kinase isoform X4 n=1 Tax=Esox lucius TaxID=8010 RepID=UPI001476C494|nr:striated muscle preferentially expressed protein kinase isoform X4 [Esox lucius]
MSNNPKNIPETGTHPSTVIPSKRARVTKDPVAQDLDAGNPVPTPPVFLRKLRKAAVGTGCDIRLRVSVAGHPAPSLRWYHNEEPLAQSKEHDAGGLWIRDCKPSDAGLYTCMASNSLGDARSCALLAVMDLGDENGTLYQDVWKIHPCEVFRSCRKQSYDSETTEDEATEPQVPMETKEGPGRHQDKAGCRVPAGEGRMIDSSPDRRATLPVVERELMALGSRPPGAQDPMHPSRVPSSSLPQTQMGPSSSLDLPQPIQTISQPTTSLSSYKNCVTSHSTQDPALGGAVIKHKIPGTSSGGASHNSGSDSGGGRTNQPARTAPKIFDKVKEFEQKVSEVSAGVKSGRSLGRTASCDRESLFKEEGESQPDAAASRRSAFGKKRASSLEDTPVYKQRVQNFQNKFTEELARIKKMVGRPNLKKAYSTEQLPQSESRTVGKLEPIPPQVIKKLEERERVLGEGAEGGRRVAFPKSFRSQELGLLDERTAPRREECESASESRRASADRVGEVSVSMETAPVNLLPGRRSPSPRVTRKSLTREVLQNSPAMTRLSHPDEEQPPLTHTKGDSTTHIKRSSPHKELEQPLHHRRPPSPRSPSPTAQRGPSPTLVREASSPLSNFPPKPQRFSPTPSPTSTLSISPLTKRRKAELKMTIPTILVEDEPMEMEEEEAGGRRERGTTSRAGKEGWTSKTHKAGKHLGKSDESDDSSADEGPTEKPEFERPLRDTTATAGSEVLLKCVITGSPLPTVTWKKGDVLIRSSPSHVVKAEGELHSLLITRMGFGDAGTYCVTAVNSAGKASCNATLYIKSEPTQEQVRKPSSLPLVKVSSPVQTDEEYLSPLDKVMEIGDPSSQSSGPQSRHAFFKEPPSFQVALTDKEVTEGQEVDMSVKVRGHPQPMVYWLRDKVTLKTAGRFIVRETEVDTSEMIITSAKITDAGIYTCKIINQYGTKQSECKLEVKAAPAEEVLAITRELQDVAVRAGESAMFECYMTGPLDVDVDWLSNGKLVQPALLNCKMTFTGKRCRLLLNSVHEDDSGMYTCKLSTAKVELTSSAHLKVTPSKEPLFTRKLDILEVIEGRTARFDCKVSGSPPPSVIWKHFENQVEESENIHLLQEGGRHSLVITHVRSDTEGFYTAIAKNVHGKAECTAELYMQEPRPSVSSNMSKLEKMPSIAEEPEVLECEVEQEQRTMPDFVKPLADLEVIEGREAVLKCKVAGLPYPTIAWYHNGKKIDSTEDRKMTQHRDVHSLVIRSACHGHGGVYKSVISNKLGKSACYAHLYITDIVPNPPDGPPVVDSITGKTITLSWKKPKRLDSSIDGSSLMYAVQQQSLGSIQWNIIASNLRETTYTVTGLSKGVRYAFRVLTATAKVLSKPSPSTDLVQLIDKGPYLRKAPVILDKPDVVYMVENQSVNITLKLNHVNALVTWKRRGVVLINKPGVYEMSMPDDDQHNLKIQRVKTADSGHLVCTAKNQFGSDLCTILLAMAVPPKFESIMEDSEIHVGEMSRFAVVVEGKPDPDILWYKDDTLLSESSHFTFVYDEAECSLVVLNARLEDSGVYTCTAKNLGGQVSCKAELTVHKVRKEVVEPVEDEGTILRRMRSLTDYYDIHKEIGRGAFSYVKRVTEKKGKVEYAAKFVSARAKRKTSALQEMNLLSELDHEKIIYFHDAFEKKNMVIIITELCHEEFLDRLTKKTSILESEVRSSIQQVLEGVSYLHQKDIAHLDIKPENILMAGRHSSQIRICDFGNAVKLDTNEAQYCKYGTPEFVAPEIVNQTPISKATDIWPIGVITYLCLTGVSPFAGENDRCTVLNIRNQNVAFEENMFTDLSREAWGFVIKLLVADRLRPNSTECLRHPWFKTITNKSVSTAMLKQVLSRRRWQRSLISYKSKMVMRSIPELLNDSSNHISIAVARHLKEGSPPPSSSSDSDEDVDELPFIPMPLSLVCSGSRVSLNEIPGEEDVIKPSSCTNGAVEGVALNRHREQPVEDMVSKKDAGEIGVARETRKRVTTEEVGGPLDEEMTAVKTKRVPLAKGSSMEEDDTQTKSRRSTMRRGSSADSALLLNVQSEEGAVDEEKEDSGNKILKKSVSMELPNRSPSPGSAKMSQEDYALKLELMRQRLMRGGNSKSGLRGPLLETLGMDEERHTSSLDRNLRRSGAGGPERSLARAASTESTVDDPPKTKVFRKSSSFSQGDSEPMPLHRRFGAPLEIPTASHNTEKGERVERSHNTEKGESVERSHNTEKGERVERSHNTEKGERVERSHNTEKGETVERSHNTEKGETVERSHNTEKSQSTERITEGKELQEAASISAITEQTKLETRPISNWPSSIQPVPVTEDQGVGETKEPEEQKDSKTSVRDEDMERRTKAQERVNGHESMKEPSQVRSLLDVPPVIMIEEDPEEKEQNEKPELEIEKGKVKAGGSSPVIMSKEKTSAYASIMQTIVVPSGKSDSSQRSTPSPTLPEHPAVFAKVATERPTSPTISTRLSTALDHPTTPRQSTTPLRTDIKDIDSEEVFEARFKKRESSLTRGLRRLTRTKSDDKSPTLPLKAGEGEEVYRPGRLGAPLEMVPQGLHERSKSVQDLREVDRDTGSLGIIGRFSMRTKRTLSMDKKMEKPKVDKVKDEKPKEAEPEITASKRRVSWAIGRSKSLDTTQLDNIEAQREQEGRERKKMEESSVFAMRRKFENKVAGISASLRSKSEERKEDKEAKRRMEEEKSNKCSKENDLKKVNDSPVLAMRKKFENKVVGISGRGRSQSEDRKETVENPEGKKTTLFSRHRHSQSEGRGLKEMGIPENQLAKQTHKESKASKESIGSVSSIHSDKSKSQKSLTPETDRRSRWDRWGLGRSRKDKNPSQTDLPSDKDEGSSGNLKHCRTSSDFPPVFHIKLKDHVLLEGDPVTLSCLPAGSPHPQITWTKDKKPLEIDDRMNLISCPDGRQLITIMKTSRRDAGLYECVATNPLASVSSSCTLSLACVPKRPGTPEVPQTYNNTALVLWKPADTKAPCSYSLERKTEGGLTFIYTGDANWSIIATGVADCYYNVRDLPPGGTFRFRVACVNKAGQGPYSNISDRVSLDSTVGVSSPAVAIVKTVPAPPRHPAQLGTTLGAAFPLAQPVVTHPPREAVSTSSPSSHTSTQTSLTSPVPSAAPPSHAPTPLPAEPLVVPSPPVVKPPPFVLPKPQSPVNVVPPMTQTPPPLATPPATPTKPSVVTTVPTYSPAATTYIAPPPLPAPSFSPQVLQVTGLSPMGEGRGTPVRGTSTGRVTPKPGETALRQGVPQKPYTFLDEKARGRFGVVRECRENATGHVFMAKIVPYDQETKKSILQEYEILKSLHNDKIMALHEAYVTPRYLVLVAEYCTGKELLYSLIDRFRYSEDDVVGYLVQILQGLEYLHNKRILHLDIKPDNIMVTNLNVIKIVDFGSAQNFNPLLLKQYSSGLSTLEYMSPEMIKGDVIGPPADIWSLGVVAYVMLSGRLPFHDKDRQQTETKIQMAKFDPTKLYPNVSQSASMFLKKMLSSYAWARPSTKDCFTHAWLQDSYLMKLRRQTLTFTTTKLKEFLGEHHRHRAEVSTKHKVLLRSYSSTASPTAPSQPHPPK